MNERRPETGPMQFGDDWPGVFIRGDNANYYGFQLDMMLTDHENRDGEPIRFAHLSYLARLLKSCDVRRNPEVQNARLHDTRWSFDEGLRSKLLEELEREGFDGFDSADAAIILDAVWCVVEGGCSIDSDQKLIWPGSWEHEKKGVK